MHQMNSILNDHYKIHICQYILQLINRKTIKFTKSKGWYEKIKQFLCPTATFILEISNLWQTFQKSNIISSLVSYHTFSYALWVQIHITFFAKLIFTKSWSLSKQFEWRHSYTLFITKKYKNESVHQSVIEL